MGENARRLKVLSVVGAGRSGTTVLASILGEVDGFASAGETRWLWERGIGEGQPCGCGRPPLHCDVWGPVLARAVEELGAQDPPVTVDAVIRAQRELNRSRNMLRVIRSAESGRDLRWEPLVTARSAIGAVCSALGEETPARVLVDTSKRAVDAAVIASLGTTDHYVLHIVRDPRGVVHSWRRGKSVASASGGTATIEPRGLPGTVRRWTKNALLAEALRRRVDPSRWMHLRYEDFAADPRASAESIVAFLGEAGAVPFVDDRTVALGPNHIVIGNPSRFTTGDVRIRADEEWRSAMSRRDQHLVAAATLPLMVRYGYAGRGRRS